MRSEGNLNGGEGAWATCDRSIVDLKQCGEQGGAQRTPSPPLPPQPTYHVLRRQARLVQQPLHSAAHGLMGLLIGRGQVCKARGRPQAGHKCV